MPTLDKFLLLGHIACKHELEAANRSLDDKDRQRLRELAARYRELQFNLLSEEEPRHAVSSQED